MNATEFDPRSVVETHPQEAAEIWDMMDADGDTTYEPDEALAASVTAIAPDLRRPLCASFRRNLLKTLHKLNPGWSAEPRVVTAGFGSWTISAPDGEVWAQDSTEEEARTDLDRHLFSLAKSAACAQAVGRAECMVGTLRPDGWQWAEMSMADARKAADLALVAGVPVKLAPIAEDYTS